MVRKRKLFLLIVLLVLILPSVLAELEVSKKAIIDAIVPETKQKAVYEFTIKNLGEYDFFEIYSLVGVQMWPNESFFLIEGQTKKLEVELWPEEAVLKKPGTFNFVYKIKSSKGEMQEDILLLKIINLKDALDINSYNINLESDKAIVYVRNKISLPFPKIKAGFSSEFFDFAKEFSLNAYEKKEFEVSLDKEKTKKLVAGSYLISTEIETYNTTEKIEDSFRFTEKEDIRTEETKKGFLISRTEIKKINEGNLPTLIEVKIDKNILSRLFTNFNFEAKQVEREGFKVVYTFQKEIMPGETWTLKANTNWFYPLLLVVAIIIIALLVRAYTSTFVILRKRATFVKTKGGEFALKISIFVRAKKYVESVKVIDKIPSLVKVHERFGAVEPDKIDERNRRLEWNIGALQPFEERVFSYVIYSKITPIGKFELPTATAVCEREGKIHESSSNKVFFITEPRKKE